MFGFRRRIQPADRLGPSGGALPPCQSCSAASARGTMTTAASLSPRGASSVRQEPAAAPARSSSSSSSSWSFLSHRDASPSADNDATAGGAAPSVQAGLTALARPHPSIHPSIHFWIFLTNETSTGGRSSSSGVPRSFCVLAFREGRLLTGIMAPAADAAVCSRGG